MDIAVEIDVLPFDRVCRTCLCTSDDLLEPQETLSFERMLNQTFGQIIVMTDELPHKVCVDCQDIIRKSYEFKIKVHKSTNILLGKDGPTRQELNSLVEDKDTQTDAPSNQNTFKVHKVSQNTIHFEDDNFDSINLQLDEDSELNPLLDNNSTTLQSVMVKRESSEDYDSAGNPEEDYEQSSPIVIVKAELNEDSDLNPFNGDESNENKYRLHKCDQCNKSFSRTNHLKRHKLTHEEGKIQCTICDKKFTRIDHLNLHVASSHSDTKPFQCEVPECKKGFVRQEQFRKHIETKHGEMTTTKDKETCDICQKAFSSKKYLRMHMKTHVGDGKGVLCKFCGKDFLDKSELNDHMSKDHQNEKPYLCSECGLRFVRNDYLVIHMRRHMGVKPYKCRFCEKGFPRATDLTVHERYHTNEKTHLCNLCGKGFQRAYNLLVHMRVHTGEKPYQCSFCNKSFSQGNDLKAHIRRHTGERFKCDLCNEGFIQGYHLTHHKRTVHGLDVKSHIRRVEKFVASTANQDGEKPDVDESEEVKNEADQYEFALMQT